MNIMIICHIRYIDYRMVMRFASLTTVNWFDFHRRILCSLLHLLSY